MVNHLPNSSIPLSPGQDVSYNSFVMEQLTRAVLVSAGLVWLVIFGVFGIVSLREKENRAASISSAIALAGAIPLFVAILLPVSVQVILLGIIGIILIISLVLFLLPVGRTPITNDRPNYRIDERDIICARAS
jgi:hypothetical protein